MVCVFENYASRLLLTMVDPREYLKSRIYYAARDGMAMPLYTLLSEYPREQADELLNEVSAFVFVFWQMVKVCLQKVIGDDGQQCTPLIIAARYGHEKVLKMLLSKFSPDLEQEGIVKFDDYVIEGASALWCAAGAGREPVCEIVIQVIIDKSVLFCEENSCIRKR